MPWLSLASFMRVSTHPDIYPRPLPIEDALENVDAWLGVPSVITGDPDRHHSRRMRELLSYSGIGGNLVNDAHLAALALQYGATVVTYDHDFALFPSVRWERPPPVGDN
jgi:toxin-antitoxin system PIN domain toxin